MTSYTNTPLTKLFLFTTLSSSVISLPYDNAENLIPEIKPNYEHHMTLTNNDWRDSAFNSSTDYTLQNESSDKIDAILGFSKKVIENSKDIDSEYVDIVNENFWDLI